MQNDFDVAVIGYGPVGATLANLLGLLGLRVIVFEREHSIYHQPRAASFDAEAMRVFQTLGLADAIAPTALPGRHIRHVNAAGKLLLHLKRPEGIGAEGWMGVYRFHQPSAETILRAGVDRFPLIDVRLRSEVYALDETADQVQIRFENLRAGTLAAVTARYVVGCDGARSTVRRFMGAEIEDLRSHESWIVLDMILDCAREEISNAVDEDGLFVDSMQLCDPARPTTCVPMPGQRHRWEFMLLPSDDPKTITQPEAVWQLLRSWNIGPHNARIERAAVYTFHSALATRWRRDNLLLAGDAAHQMPPFLGQGLCSGIRDAANLAWRLGAVIAGDASPGLLDSYESERAPHVRAFIELAVKLGSIIQTTDPEKARQRDEELVANPTLLEIIVPALGPGLHTAVPPAGRRAAQPRLADGTRFDDRVGYRFAVLASDLLLAALPPMQLAALERGHVAIIAASGEAAEYLARLGAGAIIIRPDRVILGAATTATEFAAIAAMIPPAQHAAPGEAVAPAGLSATATLP